MSPIVAAVGLLYAVPFALRAWRRRSSPARIVQAIERLTGAPVAWAEGIDAAGQPCVHLPAEDPILAALTLRDAGTLDRLVELVVADPSTAMLYLHPGRSRQGTIYAVVEHGEAVPL